ncbi:hypothetical protein C2G38_2194012 [Gigaspora rosea]|uniref:Uncharacterized protein n=1 Tax=Gigaspora rosea TaxID=44941 RepID=A0A397UX37_9GLOM|nr:hypothetical protein C2G38_2194012 [Gigaspora rosea]
MSMVYTPRILLPETYAQTPLYNVGKALANVLCKNTTLISLVLMGNYLASEGGKAIADALYKNTTLTSLNLQTNDLGKEGGKTIADALYKNTTLNL